MKGSKTIGDFPKHVHVADCVREPSVPKGSVKVHSSKGSGGKMTPYGKKG
jgi:hypothetical protein